MNVCFAQGYFEPFSTHSSFAGLSKENQTFGLLENNVKVMLPIQKEHTTYLTGLTYNILSLNNFPELKSKHSFKTIKTPVGIKKKIGDRHTLLMLVIPYVSTDQFNDYFNNLTIAGLALCTFEKRDNLKYKIGLYYSAEYFGHLFVPLLGVDWKVNESLRMYGNLPISFTVKYNVAKFISTGLDYKATNISYYNNANDAYMHEINKDFMFLVDIKLYTKIVLSGFAGISTSGKYLLYNESDKILFDLAGYRPNDTRISLNNVFGDLYFFKVKLAYRIDL